MCAPPEVIPDSDPGSDFTSPRSTRHACHPTRACAVESKTMARKYADGTEASHGASPRRYRSITWCIAPTGQRHHKVQRPTVQRHRGGTALDGGAEAQRLTT